MNKIKKKKFFAYDKLRNHHSLLIVFKLSGIAGIFMNSSG